MRASQQHHRCIARNQIAVRPQAMPHNRMLMQPAQFMVFCAQLCGGWRHYVDRISDMQKAENWEEWHWPVCFTRSYMYIFSLDEHLLPDLILTCMSPSLAEAGWAFWMWRELHHCCRICVAEAAQLWRLVARVEWPHRQQ